MERVAESNDATAVCLESITGTIKGLVKANYVVEHNPSLTAADKKSLKQFLLYRYNPAVYYILLIIHTFIYLPKI